LFDFNSSGWWQEEENIKFNLKSDFKIHIQCFKMKIPLGTSQLIQIKNLFQLKGNQRNLRASVRGIKTF